MNLKSLGRKFLTAVNKIVPKKDQVIFVSYPNNESGAIEVANQLAINYKVRVLYTVSKEYEGNPKGLLDPSIELVSRASRFDMKYLSSLMSSKYVFITHGIFLDEFPSNQIVVNLWHGILYKKIGRLLGYPGVYADFTVGTSPLTKRMFSEAFDVPEEKVTVTGYPRNDAMIRTNRDKVKVLDKLELDLSSYDKILMWLPTYRKSVEGDIRQDGKETGNPFYIDCFDIERFNSVLKDNNAFCIIKPHPMAPKYEEVNSYSNFTFIDDEWISRQGISLYELLGCTDMLISDVSSVVIDYLLLNQPIICISTDLEEYANTRGFYFDDIKEWLPSHTENQMEFFSYLNLLLSTGKDPNESKRKKLKDLFFSFGDEFSAERLLQVVLKNQQ